jgi:hypothetical protein
VLTYHRGAPSFRRSDLRVDFFGAASVFFSRRWKLARPVFSCALLTSWFSLPGELRAPIFCFVRRARNRCALSSFLVPRSRSSVTDQIRFLPSAPRNSPGARVSCSSARSAHAAREFSQHPVLSSVQSQIFTSVPISSAWDSAPRLRFPVFFGSHTACFSSVGVLRAPARFGLAEGFLELCAS